LVIFSTFISRKKKNKMEGMIGEIRLFAGNFAPKNWSYCNGATINIASNTALFSILGTTYGGNGTTNFQLPNLQSRVAIGAGQGPGLSPYVLGQAAGVESVTLTVPQMPAHVHSGTGMFAPFADSAGNDETNPGGEFIGKPAADLFCETPEGVMAPFPVSISLAPQGGNQPHSNLMPLLGMNYVICMYGIFPSRN
jgi:microcystin-dependent protein